MRHRPPPDNFPCHVRGDRGVSIQPGYKCLPNSSLSEEKNCETPPLCPLLTLKQMTPDLHPLRSALNPSFGSGLFAIRCADGGHVRQTGISCISLCQANRCNLRPSLGERVEHFRSRRWPLRIRGELLLRFSFLPHYPLGCSLRRSRIRGHGTVAFRSASVRTSMAVPGWGHRSAWSRARPLEILGSEAKCGMRAALASPVGDGRLANAKPATMPTTQRRRRKWNRCACSPVPPGAAVLANYNGKCAPRRGGHVSYGPKPPLAR
jgi:hypothetical protein